jgi:hypothetical protein
MAISATTNSPTSAKSLSLSSSCFGSASRGSCGAVVYIKHPYGELRGGGVGYLAPAPGGDETGEPHRLHGVRGDGGLAVEPDHLAAVSRSFVAKQPSPARKRASCSLVHLLSWPALTSVQWYLGLSGRKLNFSSALDFSDSLLLEGSFL